MDNEPKTIIDKFFRFMPKVMPVIDPYIVKVDSWRSGRARGRDGVYHEQVIVRVGNYGFSWVLVNGEFREFALVRFTGRGNSVFDIVSTDWMNQSQIIDQIEQWKLLAL